MLPIVAASSLGAVFVLLGAGQTYVAILWGALVAIPAAAAGLIAKNWARQTKAQRIQSIVAGATGLGLTWVALWATLTIVAWASPQTFS